jgi:hypothetical protein
LTHIKSTSLPPYQTRTTHSLLVIHSKYGGLFIMIGGDFTGPYRDSHRFEQKQLERPTQGEGGGLLPLRQSPNGSRN